MSHENFLRMHDAFRAQKSMYGIDLLNPRGVTIGDKQYPAIHKTMLLGHPDLSHTTPKRYDSIFHIPLESGNRISIDTFHDGYVAASLIVPKIHIGDNGERTYRIGHFSHYTGDEDYHQIVHEPGEYIHRRPQITLPTIDDLVKKWSKYPSMGTYDWDKPQGFEQFQKIRPNYDGTGHNDSFANHDDENLLLNTDELSEHRQNYKGDPVKENPTLVRVWAHKGPSAERNSAKYTYNTKTEQLFEGHGE